MYVFSFPLKFISKPELTVKGNFRLYGAKAKRKWENGSLFSLIGKR